MITKPEEQWIAELIPQHSWKGQRLYHRKASMTPKQRLVSDFLDRFKDEGIVTSEQNMSLTAMNGGFITSFLEKDGKYKGLAYRQDLRGNEINLETPYCPTRRDADGYLEMLIRAYNK
ncbi:MAG: hypothetical protein LC124_06465 [Ignavibacteriales bacterium]|nr:hypothetical protein [Ignavibacteriales bacterium]